MSITLIPGFGTTFGHATTQVGVYTFLGEVLDLDPVGGGETKEIKTTHMLSAAKTHTYIGGLVEPGIIKVVIHQDKTEYGGLLAIQGTLLWFEVLYSDGSKETQQGFIRKIGPKVDIEGVNTVELEMKMSGPITYTAAP